LTCDFAGVFDKVIFRKVHDADAAKRHGATVGQHSLALLLHHSPVILPIPVTSSVEHLEENVKAQDMTLSGAEWAEIEAAAKG
jgi:aryl-alcohol dehydrogenase-like predicted oxidoreductase